MGYVLTALMGVLVGAGMLVWRAVQTWLNPHGTQSKAERRRVRSKR